MKYLFIILFMAAVGFLHAQQRGDTVGTVKPTRETSVHDPVMIQQGDTYYLFVPVGVFPFFLPKI